MPFVTPPPRTYLFTDYRHIRCGDLDWRAPGTGEALPVAGPPGEPVDAVAATGLVPHGVCLVAQPSTKWDRFPTGLSGLMRVIHDGGMYRGWSLAVEYPPDKDLGSYSTVAARAVRIIGYESADGFEWRERSRSAIRTPGWTMLDGFGVCVDPAGKPAERYKAVFMARGPVDQEPALLAAYEKLNPRWQDERIIARRKPTCLYAAVSPDGECWTGLPDPLLVHYSDTDTTVTYNAGLGRYLLYTRLYPHDRRTIGIAEAEDFRRWGPVSPLIWPALADPLSVDIYTNGYSAYPGLPQYHLMFPMFYQRYTQRSVIELYSSADGLVWNRVPGGPVITPGPHGAWDSEFIVAGKDLVPLGPDRVAVPYLGTPYPHKYPRWPAVLAAMRVGWVGWTRGRLVAVRADESGEFWTRPVTPAGNALRLNLRTARAGEVRVGLFDVAGRSVAECDPISGDQLSAPVSWRGETSLKLPNDQPVTIHFQLRAADVFGFEWVG